MHGIIPPVQVDPGGVEPVGRGFVFSRVPNGNQGKRYYMLGKAQEFL
ncbi:hypothetical protein MTY_2323 [Moorella thermoacetica Y72]|uniref:Uncharacterized protein n=1 Tax=Moorella thermoacetica Y72 TaxID=1325331 RepID=A0A0S6UCY1_NEOTH|nr:hypothetical protein MTY_2323 [Moorella thermoacetica Y72]